MGAQGLYCNTFMLRMKDHSPSACSDDDLTDDVLSDVSLSLFLSIHRLSRATH